MKILAIITALILVVALAYGGWTVTKWINYSFAYKSNVIATVCEIVKPESLSEPCK
jgi:hypothetical protein